MPERPCLRWPVAVLIFSFIAALAVATYCVKMKAHVLTSKIQARQMIKITTHDCRIEDFDYQDQRVLFSSDLSDVDIKAEDENFDSSKKISVQRQYLGGAEINFRLKGKLGHDGLLYITNTHESTTDYYCSAVVFDKNGSVDITVLIIEDRITVIY